MHFPYSQQKYTGSYFPPCPLTGKKEKVQAITHVLLNTMYICPRIYDHVLQVGLHSIWPCYVAWQICERQKGTQLRTVRNFPRTTLTLSGTMGKWFCYVLQLFILMLFNKPLLVATDCHNDIKVHCQLVSV
jgi:hypothetical protein